MYIKLSMSKTIPVSAFICNSKLHVRCTCIDNVVIFYIRLFLENIVYLLQHNCYRTLLVIISPS